MSSIPVLVTSVGGNVGQGVVKALRATGRFRTIGVDMEPLSAGFSLVDGVYVVPRAGAADFADRVGEICRGEAVAAVFVCSDAEIVYYSEARSELEARWGCPIFVNPPEVVAVGNDKLRTARFLADAGLPHPLTVLASDADGVQRLLDAHGFPVLLKPRQGASARSIFLVDSLIQLAAARTLVPDMVAQQYLPGDEAEFTAGTVSDAAGRVRATIVLRRELLQGTTYRSELIEDAAIAGQIERIVTALGAVGPCNVQFRLIDGVVYPFEINPRFSGTSGIRYLHGFNDPELVYDTLVHGGAEPPALRPGVVLRYWDEVHIPEATFDHLRHAQEASRGRIAAALADAPTST
jgi:carbamoyl-phosphate synthase large subunit